MNEYISSLIQKYIAGTASAEEEDELFYWLRKGNYDATIRAELIKVVPDAETDRTLYDAERWEPLLQQVMDARGVQAPPMARKRYIGRRWMIAACLFVLTGMLLFTLWMSDTSGNKITTAKHTQQQQDVLPGKNGAVLTLADGTQVVLDSVANGSLGLQGNSQVTKTNGLLSYDSKTDAANANTLQEPLYNLLSTPKGRQFQLVLPDGTKVWLNAMSSIRFPAAFLSNHRTVELTGEAYFEVAKDPSKPFHVKVAAAGNDELDVQALGTEFNINAYNDEPAIKTTLLEGKVVVKSEAGNQKPEVGSPKSDASSQTSGLRPPTSVILKPGEQVVAKEHSPLTIHHSPSIEQVIAWKNGFFILDGTSIQTVMRQISRWYDVDVVYKGNFSGDDFAGQIPRTATLLQVLKMLELTDIIQFKIDGKQVIVSQRS